MAASEPTTLVLALEDPDCVDDVPRLRARLHELLAGREGVLIVCDVAVLVDPDVATLDALARLALEVRRAGARIRLSRASPGLRGLVALAGLGEVLPCAESGLEPERQPEHREEARRVEEEGDPGDPIA